MKLEVNHVDFVIEKVDLVTKNKTYLYSVPEPYIHELPCKNCLVKPMCIKKCYKIEDGRVMINVTKKCDKLNEQMRRK